MVAARRASVVQKNGLGRVALRCLRLLMLLAGVTTIGCSSFIAGSSRPPQPTPLDASELKYGIARMSERDGSLDDARAAYLKILEAHPDHLPSLHRLGVVSLRLERVDEAIAYLERAVAAGPPSGELLGDLGYTQFIAGDLSTARKTMLEALERSPMDERLINNLALVLGYEGRTSESLELFRRVGSEADSLSNVGMILAQTGQLREAKQYFHRAIELDPSAEAAARGLLELRDIELAEGHESAREASGRETSGRDESGNEESGRGPSTSDTSARSATSAGSDTSDTSFGSTRSLRDSTVAQRPLNHRLGALAPLDEGAQVEQRGADQHDGDRRRQASDDW